MTRTKNLSVLLFSSLSVCVLVGCSSAKQDYEEVLTLQQATEQALQQTTDYDIKLKSCDDMMRVLDEFLKKHPQGEWSDVARTALQSWQSRKTALFSERSSLVDELGTRLRNRAIEAARSAHGMSNIETVDLESRDQRTEGNRILVTDVYAVRMKGAILRMHIFKLRVTTSGYIATDEKRIAVNERVNVQE